MLEDVLSKKAALMGSGFVTIMRIIRPEIGVTLKAARQTQPKRLICAFQPHRYTRTKLLFDEFSRCFADCDQLILTDIYSAGEFPIDGVSGASLAEAVTEATQQQVTFIPTLPKLEEYLFKIAEPGDLIMTVAAGDIFKVGEELVTELERGRIMMNKNDVVAVIMGGPSAEREISLVTGAAIAGALREKGYNVAEIDLEPKKLALQLEECSAKVVFNAVHGMYGEMVGCRLYWRCWKFPILVQVCLQVR